MDAHMREDLVFGRRTTQQAARHTAYLNGIAALSSRQSMLGQGSFVLPSSGVSDIHSGHQQQQQSFLSHDELAGSLQYAQTAYRNSPPNVPSQSTTASTESNAMFHEYAQNVGGSYYTDSDNVSVPIAAPYRSSDVSAPDSGQALAGSSSLFMDSNGRFVPATQDPTHVNNNVVTPAPQHSGLSAGVEDMDVDDDAEDNSLAKA
jgi:hypothetical protein